MSSWTASTPDRDQPELDRVPISGGPYRSVVRIVRFYFDASKDEIATSFHLAECQAPPQTCGHYDIVRPTLAQRSAFLFEARPRGRRSPRKAHESCSLMPTNVLFFTRVIQQISKTPLRRKRSSISVKNSWRGMVGTWPTHSLMLASAVRHSKRGPGFKRRWPD